MFRQLGLRVVVAVVAVAAMAGAGPAFGQQALKGVLQGVVKDSSGKPVEGAFVKMRNADKRLIFMVTSKDQGRYTYNRLPSGKYVVQGVGGELQSGWSAPVDVADGRSAMMDVSLTDQRAPRLPNAWPGRQPGQVGGEGGGGEDVASQFPDGDAKRIILTKCNICHTAARMIGYPADRQRWQETIDDMKLYMAGSTIDISLSANEESTLMDYVVKNLAAGEGGRAATKKPDPNSRLPRTLVPPGEGRNYVAVEYEIPRANTEPHEVTVDSDGNGWITQRRGGNLGRLDPRTLTYTEVSPPPAKSKMVSLNGIWGGKNNKLWFLDVGPNRRWMAYDTKSKEFSTYNMTVKLRSGGAGGNTMRDHPNGTVWFNAIGNNAVLRLDLKTGKFDNFQVPSGVKSGNSAGPYGMVIAGDGNVWVALNRIDKLAKVDPVTGNMEEFDIPATGAVPRKGGPDANGDVWFGLHGAGKIVKVDHKTNKMTVYEPPTKDSGTYAVSVDMKANLIWVAQQHADKIARFNPKTGTWVEFPLAQAEEDHRRIEVDLSYPNRVWWSGNDSNRIGYVEVLSGNGTTM